MIAACAHEIAQREGRIEQLEQEVQRKNEVISCLLGKLASVNAELRVTDQAARAVVDWWMPTAARTRSFAVWFDKTLPDLREAVGRPRSMADEVQHLGR